MPPEYNTDRTHPFVSIKKTPHPGDFWRARYTFTSKHIRQFGFQFIVLEAAIQRYIKRVREDENGEIPIVKEYLEQRSSSMIQSAARAAASLPISGCIPST